MAERRLVAAAVALVAGLLVLTACGGSGSGPDLQTPRDTDGYQGIFLADQPYRVPDVALTDTDGKEFSIATSPAKVKIVFFGYTNCPDVCNIVMSTIAGALTRLTDDERAQVQAVFVTTDPARDDEREVLSYTSRFSPDFVGLTGPLKQISALGKPLKIFVENGTKLPSGGYEVDHSTYVYGITGTAAEVIWDQATSPADMTKDIRKLLASKETS